MCKVRTKGLLLNLYVLSLFKHFLIWSLGFPHPRAEQVHGICGLRGGGRSKPSRLGRSSLHRRQRESEASRDPKSERFSDGTGISLSVSACFYSRCERFTGYFRGPRLQEPVKWFFCCLYISDGWRGGGGLCEGRPEAGHGPGLHTGGYSVVGQLTGYYKRINTCELIIYSLYVL